jgi:hypothetical protein
MILFCVISALQELKKEIKDLNTGVQKSGNNFVESVLFYCCISLASFFSFLTSFHSCFFFLPLQAKDLMDTRFIRANISETLTLLRQVQTVTQVIIKAKEHIANGKFFAALKVCFCSLACLLFC